MKNRKKLPKLKMNKNTKKLIRMVNKIIETTSTDDMNITDINLMQFAGALLITNCKQPFFHNLLFGEWLCEVFRVGIFVRVLRSSRVNLNNVNNTNILCCV